MKTLKCDLCEHEARGETFEAWMEAMKPHYAEAHSDFMKKQGEKSQNEQKEEMQKWMKENRARFEVLPENN